MDDLDESIELLQGRRSGLRYSDLARILRRCGCEEVSRRGSHRTWHHPAVQKHLTLIDHGAGEVLAVYVRETRNYLIAIRSALNSGR